MFRSLLLGLLSFLLTFSAFEGNAQTFNGQGGLPVPPGAPGQTVGITTSIATVSGVGILGEGCSFLDRLTLDFTHTWTGDLALFLIAPSGEMLELSSGNGSSGDNFQVTVFTDNTPLFITQGSPPYNGSFRPEGRNASNIFPYPDNNPLGTFTFANRFTGINADGDWTLYINDYLAIDVGMLNSWSLTFEVGNGPAPQVTLGPDVTICPGQSTTLTASVTPTADSYLWSTGATSSSITVNPASTTTYSVTVTNNDCIDADTIQVVVNPTGVVANAGADQSVCQGTSTTLMGSGGGPGATYNWSTGQSGSTISVNPSTTTTYTLTVTSGGCTGTDQVVVNVTPIPVAEAGQPVSICEGQTVTLTASGGFQNNHYSWSTGQTGATINVAPLSTTLYTVTVTINGCSDTDDVLVTVNDLPTVDAGDDVQICEGESVNLSASGSTGTYQWSTGQSGPNITVTPSITTTYTVTVTENGCTASDNVTVTVGNIVAGVTPDQSICEGSSVTLTATGGTSYEWSSGETGASITVSPVISTTYTVTATQGGCTDEASVTITVNPIPVATVSPDEEICAGESVVLTASGGTTYLWNNGQTTSTITVTPLTTTVYSVTVTSAGCSSSETVTVDVNPSPNAFAGNDQNLCIGESVTLTATGLPGPGTYEWSTGETTPSITVEPTVTTTYFVTITNEWDCVDTDDVTVTVNAIPVANAGPDVDLCSGFSTTLTATGGTIPSSYQWSTGQIGSSITVNPTATTTYTVTVTVAGCSSEDDVEVNVFPSPVASAGLDQEICAGNTVELTASGGGTYEWSNGQTTQTIDVTPAVTTTYTVTVSASNGCSDEDNVTVVVFPGPVANAGPDKAICDGETTSLTGSGGGEYDWSNGASTPTISVSPTATTLYQLTVTDANGCTDTDEASVEVNLIPVANAGPNVFIVSGESTTLSASGGGTYLWSTGETTSQITVAPTVTTTYSVTVTINGCSDIDDVTVFVNEAPSVDLGPDQSICDGESLLLDATISGAFDLEYEWSTGQTTSIITVAPTTTTTYSVTATDLTTGLFTTDDITVVVNPIPLANAGPDVDLCEGENIQLTATGGDIPSSYEWSTGETGSTITVSPVINTTYSVTVTVSGCSSEDAMEITVLPVPVANAGTDQNICEGETVTLTANGGSTFQWSTGESMQTIEVSPLTSTTYSVSVMGSNGCVDVDDIVVTVFPKPQADAGPDMTICAGDSITISGNGGTNYIWNTGDATQAFIVTPLASLSYQLTVTDVNGCSDTDVISVTVNPLPVANAGQNVFLLTGQSATLTASGGGTYLWSTGETTEQISVSPAVTTTYTVTVTVNGCSAIDEVTVFVNEAPSVDLGPDQVICEGETVTIDASIIGPFNLQYLWSTGETTSIINPSPVTTTSYSVTATDITTGFSTIDTIVINVTNLPLGTPVINGDTEICAGDVSIYTVNTVTGATTYTWTVPSGANIISGQGSTSIEIDWGTSIGGPVQLAVSNSCGSLPAAISNVSIILPPELTGPINGQTDPCADGSSTYTITSIPGASYQWTLTGGGSIASGQGTANVTIDWNGSAGGDLCLVASNQCGNSSPLCISIQTTNTPSISAGTDKDVCGLNVALDGSGTGSWSVISGPGTVQFSDVNDPLTSAVTSLPGSYTLQYSLSQNGCFAEDQVEITFFENPSIINDITDCNAINTEYTVSFEVTGGQGPYLINGNSFAGGVFNSAPIVSGDSFSFIAVDVNGCQSEEFSGQVLCSCTSDAGSMDLVPLEACVDATITATYNGGNVLDANDKLAFVLHDGNFPGGIIAWNTEPVFSFLPPMQTEITYYISAVVADEGLDGLPQLNDPCLAITEGTPVRFHDIPVAFAGIDKLIGCSGELVLLDGTGSSTGAFINYSWSTQNGEISGPSDGIQINAASSGTYILLVTNTKGNCQAYDTVVVKSELLSLDNIQISINPPLCKGDCNGVIEIGALDTTLLFDFESGTFSSNPVFTEACSGEFKVSVMDTFGCIIDTVVVINEPEEVEVNLGPDVVIAPGEEVILLAETDSDIIQYNWFGADSCLICREIKVSPVETTTYTVEITDVNQCTASDEIIVSVIAEEKFYIPTVFKPDGDQVNDYFIITGNQTLEEIEHMSIFDRWGSKIFEKNNILPGDPAQGWDGTYKGMPVNPGVYLYMIRIRLTGGETLQMTGDITVIR